MNWASTSTASSSTFLFNFSIPFDAFSEFSSSCNLHTATDGAIIFATSTASLISLVTSSMLSMFLITWLPPTTSITLLNLVSPCEFRAFVTSLGMPPPIETILFFHTAFHPSRAPASSRQLEFCRSVLAAWAFKCWGKERSIASAWLLSSSSSFLFCSSTLVILNACDSCCLNIWISSFATCSCVSLFSISSTCARLSLVDASTLTPRAFRAWTICSGRSWCTACSMLPSWYSNGFP